MARMTSGQQFNACYLAQPTVYRCLYLEKKIPANRGRGCLPTDCPLLCHCNHSHEDGSLSIHPQRKINWENMSIIKPVNHLYSAGVTYKHQKQNRDTVGL